MNDNLPESGWQRFLDRLKGLWGVPREDEAAAVPGRVAPAQSESGAPAPTETSSR